MSTCNPTLRLNRFKNWRRPCSGRIVLNLCSKMRGTGRAVCSRKTKIKAQPSTQTIQKIYGEVLVEGFGCGGWI
jgi:hypothetical protein